MCYIYITHIYRWSLCVIGDPVRSWSPCFVSFNKGGVMAGTITPQRDTEWCSVVLSLWFCCRGRWCFAFKSPGNSESCTRAMCAQGEEKKPWEPACEWGKPVLAGRWWWRQEFCHRLHKKAEGSFSKRDFSHRLWYAIDPGTLLMKRQSGLNSSVAIIKESYILLQGPHFSLQLVWF